MRRLGVAAAFVAVVSAVCVGSGASATKPRLVLLASADGLRVYGPPRGGHAPCPRALPLRRDALQISRRAVRLAMPRLAAYVKLDARDARVRTVRAPRSGFAQTVAGCGGAAWQRSIVAFVRLPHAPGASLAQWTLAVARIGAGWAIYRRIH